MAIEYLGLSECQRPSASCWRALRARLMMRSWRSVADGKEKKLGRIVEINEDKAVVQVFEGTDSLVLKKYPYQTDWTSDGDRADG